MEVEFKKVYQNREEYIADLLVRLIYAIGDLVEYRKQEVTGKTCDERLKEG
jgi:hypothetical protein